MKFHKSTLPVDTSFGNTLFMATPIIGEGLKKIDKSHGGYLNHWVGGFIHITVKTIYDLQYLTLRLSRYMNAPTEPAFLALKHGMEYLMHHPHEPIMYLKKKHKKMKANINVYSKQVMHKSTKSGILQLPTYIL